MGMNDGARIETGCPGSHSGECRPTRHGPVGSSCGPGEYQTSAAGVARDRLCPHDRLAQRDRGWTDLLGASQQTCRRPESVSAMRARHVFGDRSVTPERAWLAMRVPRWNTSTLASRGPHLDNLADHAGRHGVEAPRNFDMVIRRRAGPTPFGMLVGLGRQRYQGGPVDGIEELAAAGAELAHQAGVEFVDQRPDGGVQLGDREEEAPIAPPCQDPPLDDENRRLDLCLVARLAWPA